MILNKIIETLKNNSNFIYLLILAGLIWLIAKGMVNEEYLYVITILVLAVAAFIILNLKLAYYILIALIPFGFFIKLMIKLNAPNLPFAGIVGAYKDIGIILLFSFIAYEVFMRGYSRFKISKLQVSILVFILFCILLFAVNSQNYYLGLFGLRRNLLFILLFFITLRIINDRKDIIRLVGVVMACGLVIGLGAIVQVYLLPWTMAGGGTAFKGTNNIVFFFGFLRANSFFQAPNVLGFYLAYLSSLALGFTLLEKDLLRKAGFGMISIIILLGLLFSMSRGAWAALLLGLLTWALFKFRTVLKNAYLLGIMAAIVIMFLVSNPLLVYRLTSMFNPNDVSRQSRLALISDYLLKNLNDPRTVLIGQGLDSYGILPDTLNQEVPEAGQYVDNFYIQFFLETGIIGLLLFFFILYYYLKTLFMTERTIKDHFLRSLSNCLIIATLVFIYSGLFTPIAQAFEEVTLFWIFAAVAVIMSRMTKAAGRSSTGEMLAGE